jgi:hypothetical protein
MTDSKCKALAAGVGYSRSALLTQLRSENKTRASSGNSGCGQQECDLFVPRQRCPPIFRVDQHDIHFSKPHLDLSIRFPLIFQLDAIG